MSISKQEVATKGYMQGQYKTGRGKAHLCCKPHREVFNCKMFGTFNIYIEGRLNYYEPSIVHNKKSYWFVRIEKNKKEYFGWAIRDDNSKQTIKTLEILTKEPLPVNLKDGFLKINILEKWSEKQIRSWAKDKYWFQTFDFSPEKRADSEYLWKIINRINWSGKTVFDIGCHYGYFSFKASELGARVVGMDTNTKSLEMAKIIRNNIIQQDVEFTKKYSREKKYDVVLYLSVHHQIDPEYRKLKDKIEELKNIANEHVFIELILPPMFPKNSDMTESQIDKIVGGKILARYKHKVRGIRKVYQIDLEKK